MDNDGAESARRSTVLVAVGSSDGSVFGFVYDSCTGTRKNAGAGAGTGTGTDTGPFVIVDAASRLFKGWTV